MEDFKLVVFDDKAELNKKKWNNIISTKETCI